MSWIAEYDTQGREFPTCVHVTKTTDAMTHGATYVPIEDGRDMRVENAKLRELVSLYHYGATHEASPSDVLAWSAKVDSLRRELGIEV